MLGYGYYGGRILPLDEIKIPLCDRSYFFGDAVYEVCIGRGKKIYRFSEHRDRLLNSLSGVKMNLPKDFSELENIAAELIDKASFPFFTLYIQIGRVCEERDHAFSTTDKSSMLLALFPGSAPALTEISLSTEEDKRYSYCSFKTVNLLPAVLSSARAKEIGVEETVYHRGGRVVECSHSSILIYKNEKLITPPPCPFVLPGITAKTLMTLAEGDGLSVEWDFFSLEDLFSADEVFVTSTTRLVRRARKIDGLAVGGRYPELSHRLWELIYEDFNK